MMDIIDYLEENDFIINDVDTGSATPIIRTKQIPFSDKILDFSKITGSYNYSERTGYVKVAYGSGYIKEFYNRISLAMTKLLESEQVKIKRPEEKGYYVGVITGYSSIKDLVRVGEITINLRLDPFKYDDKPYGNTLWDTFCFETDYLEQNQYEITDSATIKVYNQGESVYPSITVTSNMNVTVDNGSGVGVSYSLTTGTTKLNTKFNNGLNTITVTGNGTLTINFTQQYL